MMKILREVFTFVNEYNKNLTKTLRLMRCIPLTQTLES